VVLRLILINEGICGRHLIRRNTDRMNRKIPRSKSNGLKKESTKEEKSLKSPQTSNIINYYVLMSISTLA